MTTTRTWTVDVLLTEHEGRTRAEAVLRGEGAGRLGTGANGGPRGGTSERPRAVGLARCHPDDTDIPAIGDEVAASRALSALAHQLLDAAARNIESQTGEKARVRG